MITTVPDRGDRATRRTPRRRLLQLGPAGHRLAWRFRTQPGQPGREGPPAKETTLDRLVREGLVPLADAYKEAGVAGLSIWTMLRHANHGVRSQQGRIVRLESVKVGGKRLTSTAAVRRFLTLLNPEAGSAGDHGNTDV